jgi:predicted transposase YdaD
MVKKMNATLNNTPDWFRMLITIIATAIIMLVSLLLVSCKTQQPQVVEKIVTNTEYIDRHHYDSIFNDRIVYVDRGSDTIKMIERVIEYRYKVLTDSVEVLRIDSIPYEVQVVEIVERMNNHQRTMYWLGWLAVLIVALRLFWKVYKKIKGL